MGVYLCAKFELEGKLLCLKLIKIVLETLNLAHK